MKRNKLIKLLSNLDYAKDSLTNNFPIPFKIDGRPFFIDGISFTSDGQIAFKVVSKWYGFDFETYMKLSDLSFILIQNKGNND